MSITPATPETTPASVHAIRLSLGLIYFHFGYLKFYADLSPAELLASYTAQRLSWHWIDSETAMFCVGILECVIGLCFLFNVLLKWISPLFFLHMAATLAPLFLLPELVFKFAPLAPTIEGQYILKNFVLITAGWVVLAPQMRKFRILQKLNPRAEEALPAPNSPL